jgi:S1-C subfamily serine protease
LVLAVKRGNIPPGAFVVKVGSTGPAKSAGIKMGDTIVRIDGQSIYKVADYFKALGYEKSQQEVKVSV